MPEAAPSLGDIVNRLSNRLIRRFAGRPKEVRTDRPIVSFTFDDVPESAYDTGAVILEKYGLNGTFYVSGSLLGKVEAGRPVISLEECRELAARGHEIGCHTFSHKPLRSFAAGRLDTDLDRNADCLRQATGLPAPQNFAFPFNAAWPLARPVLRRRFRSCRAAGGGVNRGPTDPMMLRSVGIEKPDEAARGLTRLIDQIVAEPGWLVLFCHDVAESPTPYGCTPETFEHLVRHAVESGCEVLTVARALDRLGW